MPSLGWGMFTYEAAATTYHMTTCAYAFLAAHRPSLVHQIRSVGHEHDDLTAPEPVGRGSISDAFSCIVMLARGLQTSCEPLLTWPFLCLSRVWGGGLRGERDSSDELQSPPLSGVGSPSLFN
jgi:hypothetical protein